MTSVPSITGLSHINNNNNNNSSVEGQQQNQKNNSTTIQEGDYKGWLQQVQHRLEKYRHLATNPDDESAGNGNGSPHQRQQRPAVSASSLSNKKSPAAAATTKQSKDQQQQQQQQQQSDEKLIQMTRKEIEVLAAYHCELQRMIGDQNQKIDMMYDELGATHEMAERLQVEVEKKTSGGISPRRRAKQHMRQEIADTRRKIDTANNELMNIEGELEGVRAEHSEIRQFISRQFFPVARVSGDQKWPPVQDEKHFPSHIGNQFVVRPTKTAELRDQLIADRRRGFVPGTNIKSTTFGVTEVSESRKKRRQSLMSNSSRGGSPEQQSGTGRGGSVVSGASPQGISYESYIASAQRVKGIQGDGKIRPEMVGHLAFTKKKIVRPENTTSESNNNKSTRAGTPSSSRNSNNNRAHHQNHDDETNSEATASPSPMRGPSAASLGRQSNAGTVFSAVSSNNNNNNSTTFFGGRSSSSQPSSSSLRAKSPLTQEKSVFTRREDNRPFRGNTLNQTVPTSGILHHNDPGTYQ